MDQLAESFEFELSSDARILKITSEDVVQSLPRLLNEPEINALMQRYFKFSLRPPEYPIDFERLSEEYDAIEFLASEFFLPGKILSGWDCDSILIMNKEVIRG